MELRRHPATVHPPILLVLLGVFLNQSQIAFGFNVSISDGIALAILFWLFLSGTLRIPPVPVGIFLLFSSMTLAVASFITPAVIGSQVSLEAALGANLKLWASFIFFLVGFQLSRDGRLQTVIRSFYATAALISTVGALSLFGIRPSAFNSMFGYGFRFVGLMNDPNYYAVLTVVALAFLWRDTKIKTTFRYSLSVLLALGVLASASKTGTLTLMLWAGYTLITTLWRSNVTAISKSLLSSLVIVALSAPLAAIMAPAENTSEGFFSGPAAQRVLTLFTDFQSAVAGGGSGRDITWDNALQIIERLPVLGTGAGGYGSVANQLFGNPVLAHNTLLQLFAEWGIPAALLFWGLVLVLLFKKAKYSNEPLVSSLRDALGVFLVGSLGISLNNARLFWVVLGALTMIVIYQTNAPLDTETRVNTGSTSRPHL